MKLDMMDEDILELIEDMHRCTSDLTIQDLSVISGRSVYELNQIKLEMQENG